MHVLIVTAGSHGDVHPFVGLGRVLAGRGHDVVVLGNEVFAGMISGAGLEFVEHGTAEQYRKATEDPDLWHPTKGLRVVFAEGVVPALEPTLETIRARRRDDTVVVAGTLGLGARVAQEVDGTPLASVQLAPSVFRSVFRMPRFAGMPNLDWAPRWFKRAFWRFADSVSDPLIAPALNVLLEREGKPPVTRVFHEWLHSPQLVVGMFPDWFAPPQPDWPLAVKLTGFPLWDEGTLDPDLERWLDKGEKPVVFTAGSANRTAHRFFRESVAARPGRALLITSNRASVPDDLPDGVRWEAYAPFSQLLPRCRALVSHGGIGSIAAGIAAGIPQVCTPMAFDQFDNASRLVDAGIGVLLPMKRYTGKRAARALARLPALQPRCLEMRDRLPPDPLSETANLIEGLARETPQTEPTR